MISLDERLEVHSFPFPPTHKLIMFTIGFMETTHSMSDSIYIQGSSLSRHALLRLQMRQPELFPAAMAS